MSQDTLTPEQFDAEWDAQANAREAGTQPPEQAAADASTAEPTKAPAAPAQAQAAREAPASKEDDPYAGLSPALRQKLERIDALERDFTQTKSDFKAAQGRIGAMQRELDVAKQATAQTQAQKPSEAQIAAAAKSPEKWEAMKADFPEWGEAIESMVESRLGAIKPQAAPTLDMSEIDRRVGEAVARERRERVEEYVEDRHPGWKRKVNAPEFGTWFDLQPPEIKNLAQSPNARDAVRLLDLFKEHNEAPAANVQQDRKQRLQQAATQKPGSVPPPKGEADMNEDELWDHMAKQRAQRRDGAGRWTR